MPFLYGNKTQRVYADGEDIEDILPIIVNGGIVAEGESGEVENVLGPTEGICEGVDSETNKTIVEDGVLTEGLTEGLGIVTAESKLAQKKEGILVTDVIDDKALVEGVEGRIEKVVGEENVPGEVEGIIDTDVVDDKLPEEKEGTISTNLNIVDNKCIKPS